ncbi:adenosylcobinamide-GDP ribazoletransferase [Halorussus lipolyticus]|uniref:adenosylcobinamide-GDP ribazoletransferase n=1 Tax=Halorussus lipolyticus TaxID=3034024 RepID=UPI0023E7D589|nr:adenosylcobinamide-GDP ribazoletransferase [Halorussus sp. DT80]
MVLTATKGAVGFLTRIPTGRSEEAWVAFSETPTAFPLAGWVVGLLSAVPLLGAVLTARTLGPVPAPTVAFGYLLAVYAVTGINHADGVADLGDAAVVHGDPDDRRDVLKDTEVGVGAVLALGAVLVGLGLAGLALADAPPVAPPTAAVGVPVAVGIAVSAEVGAKFGMAALACLGSPAFEGLGSAFTDNAPTALVAPALAAVPVGLLGVPAIAALAGAVATAMALLGWSRANLGGVNGDVFGAANELGRIAGLHLGVVAWTLS